VSHCLIELAIVHGFNIPSEQSVVDIPITRLPKTLFKSISKLEMVELRQNGGQRREEDLEK
jgi:hypothetical protein